MWLLFFGIVHGTLIWNGDILLFCGSFALLALYPLRNVRANRLVTIGLAMSLAGGTLGISNGMGLSTAWHSAALQEQAAKARAEHKELSTRQQTVVDAAVALRPEEIQSISETVTVGRSPIPRTGWPRWESPFFAVMRFQSVSSSNAWMCPLFTQQSQCWMQDPSHMLTFGYPGT